jgi:hypothetical protein
MHFYMHSYLHKIFILVKSGCYSIVVGRWCRLGSYAKEVKSLSQETSRMAQEYGVAR